MPFALVCITGTLLVLSLALGSYGQITAGGMSGVASISADSLDGGEPLDEFAFTDEEQGRFNWIVSATDLPWIGAYRFQPSTTAPATLLLSVSDTSGVALAQCAFPRGGVGSDENQWTEFVWSLQADSLHCNVSTSATRFRFPLRAIPRKRYVVRVSAIEGPRCIAGLMIRNQKPTGCPPRFQRVVFVSQGFNCGCPPRITHESPVVGTLLPEHRPDLQQEQIHKPTPVAFPRFEPATSGLFDPTTTAAPIAVDDLTSPAWLSHLSGGSVAQVAPTVTEGVIVRESSPEWPPANPHIKTTEFPFPVWTNSSRATISPVNNLNSNPVRTTVDAARASATTTPLPLTTAKATTKTTPFAATTLVARKTTTTTTTNPPTTTTTNTFNPRSSPRAKGQSPSGGQNATASPSLTSSIVDLVDATSGAASTRGQTSTTSTTASVDGAVASAPNITVTCSEASCQNNGTCVVVSSVELLCICPYGYNGTFCEFALPCATNPCQNGGVCEPVDDTFRCDCPPNTSGELCESYLCDNECHNGGVCIVDENQFTKCNCTPGFLGYNCNLLDVCSGVVTPCDVFGPTATCQVVDEHASPFLVNATYQCLCPDGNNGQVECASLLTTTPVTADMPSAITTSAPLSTSTMTSARATSTMTSTTSPPTTSTTTGWTTSASTLTTQLWTTTSILAETTGTTGGFDVVSPVDGVNAVEERAQAGPVAPTTIILVVVGVVLLLVLLFLASLLSVRFVRRSRKLHGKYNPAKEESMVGAGLSLPMATINKEERLI